MPRIVMNDAIGADFLARPTQRLLTFADLEHFGVQWFVGTFTSHSFKQCPSI
jgi:hypothetical protein